MLHAPHKEGGLLVQWTEAWIARRREEAQTAQVCNAKLANLALVSLSLFLCLDGWNPSPSAGEEERTITCRSLIVGHNQFEWRIWSLHQCNLRVSDLERARAFSKHGKRDIHCHFPRVRVSNQPFIRKTGAAVSSSYSSFSLRFVLNHRFLLERLYFLTMFIMMYNAFPLENVENKNYLYNSFFFFFFFCNRKSSRHGSEKLFIIRSENKIRIERPPFFSWFVREQRKHSVLLFHVLLQTNRLSTNQRKRGKRNVQLFILLSWYCTFGRQAAR